MNYSVTSKVYHCRLHEIKYKMIADLNGVFTVKVQQEKTGYWYIVILNEFHYLLYMM